jgi:hypothetical protein
LAVGVVIFSFNTGTRVHRASMSAVRRMTGTLDRQPTQLKIYTHPWGIVYTSTCAHPGGIVQ